MQKSILVLTTLGACLVSTAQVSAQGYEINFSNYIDTGQPTYTSNYIVDIDVCDVQFNCLDPRFPNEAVYEVEVAPPITTPVHYSYEYYNPDYGYYQQQYYSQVNEYETEYTPSYETYGGLSYSY